MTLKTWTVLGFVGLSFVSGVAGQYFYPGAEFSPVDMWFLPIFAFLLFVWYRLDSEQRAFKRSVGLNVCIIGIAIVALPYYFFRSRGFKRGALATAMMLLFLILSGLLTWAGQYAAYYGLQS